MKQLRDENTRLKRPRDPKKPVQLVGMKAQLVPARADVTAIRAAYPVSERQACELAGIAASLLGADVNGTWNAKVETDAGSGTPVFVLKQSGEKLSGTYSGALGETQVSGSGKARTSPSNSSCRGRGFSIPESWTTPGRP